MKKLVAFGLLVATVAFAAPALADGGTLQDRELQKLFEWSGQGANPSGAHQPYDPMIGLALKDRETQKLMQWSAQAADQAAKRTQLAGSGVQQAKPVPPYQEYPGFESN